MSESEILHVVSYDVSRGAERYARSLVDALNRRGPDQHVLMTMFQGDEASLDADFALDVPRGALRRVGFDPRVIRRMRRTVRELAPRAVVAHGGEPAKYAAFALGGLAPYAYLVIGSTHPKLGNPVRGAIRKLYLSRAAVIVAVSASLAADLVAEDPSVAPRTRVIPNGRDPDIYRPGSGDGDGRSPRVLFIGHLEEQKRPLLFVEAVGELKRRGLTVTAVIVGDGPMRADVEERARSAGVEVLGAREDVPALLADADLLVATSRPPEGLPGVLIEAGLSAVAAVTTDVPGARDVVEDGVTGVVVPVDDQAGLVDSVESLLRDPDRRKGMGRAARERCLQLFTLDATTDEWDEVIRGMTS